MPADVVTAGRCMIPSKTLPSGPEDLSVISVTGCQPGTGRNQIDPTATRNPAGDTGMKKSRRLGNRISLARPQHELSIETLRKTFLQWTAMCAWFSSS